MTNYIKKSKKETDLIYQYLKKSFFECEKISPGSNLVSLLMHELIFFFSTKASLKNIRKKNYLTTDPVFGKRNKYEILKQKKNKKRIILQFFTNFIFFFLKKKIFISEYLPLSKTQIIQILIFVIFKGYRPIFLNNKKVYFRNLNLQRKILFKYLKRINQKIFKNRIPQIEMDNIDKFISKIVATDFGYKKKNIISDLYLSGTSAKINTRITLTNGLINNKKIIMVSHNKECGFWKGISVQYDDFDYANMLIGYGKFGNYKINKDKIFKPKSKSQKFRYISTSGNLKIHKTLNYNLTNFDNLKGLYISGKITNLTSIGDRVFNPLDYINWQEKLINKIKNCDIKLHPKQNKKIKYSKSFQKKIIQKKISISEVSKNYDFFIHDSPDSSSLYEILASGKPCLFFDLGYASLSKVGLKYFKERCYYFKIDLERIDKSLRQLNLSKSKKRKTQLFLKKFCNSSARLDKVTSILREIKNINL